MNFLNKSKNNDSQQIEVVRKVKHHTVRNAIITAMILAAITMTTGKAVHKNNMRVANDVEVTSDVTTSIETTVTTEDDYVTAINSPKVITTTATTANTTGKKVTMSTTTTTGVTFTDVSATERLVITEEERIPETEPPAPEPEVIEQPQIEEVHEEVVQEVVVEEPVYAEPEEPAIEYKEQEYYSDDGDYGWSHVSYRYGTPDLDADRERYHTALEYVTEEERILLINVVASEYGSDWVSVSEKAKVVAVVMNRLRNGYWGDSIYSVLAYPGQFQGYSIQSTFYRSTTPTCIDAVDYYFIHQDEWQYQGIMYISGGGTYNTFY